MENSTLFGPDFVGPRCDCATYVYVLLCFMAQPGNGTWQLGDSIYMLMLEMRRKYKHRHKYKKFTQVTQWMLKIKVIFKKKIFEKHLFPQLWRFLTQEYFFERLEFYPRRLGLSRVSLRSHLVWLCLVFPVKEVTTTLGNNLLSSSISHLELDMFSRRGHPKRQWVV